LKPLILLALVAAVAGAAWPSAVSAQRQDRNLRLPPGWDDAFFDRLDEGRSPRTTVAVMDFAGGEVLEERLRFRMSDMLITALVQAGRFDVVERERLDAILTEQELQQSGNVDPATAAMVGRLLGAELVVSGVVTRAAEQLIDRFSYDQIHVEVAVDVRAVHTTSGRVVISETAEGSADDRIVTTASGEIIRGPTNYDPLYLRATAAAIDAAGQLVSTAAPLVGFVISVRDRDVVIDLGEARGVRQGDAFVVFRRGEPLEHPVTGERIGWDKTVLAAIEIVAVEASLSVGRIVAVTERGVELRPGDLVIFRASER
jgi:hypothetical protein